MKKKLSILLITMITLILAFTGCTKIRSTFKDLTAETIGLSREFYVYDDFGNTTMTVSGKSTDMESSEVDNVILITIDGYTWQHVGSSMIAVEKGVKNLVDEYNLETNIDSGKNGTGILMSLDRKINNFKSKMTGLKRVLVIKNQSGVIVGVYEGNNVLVEQSSLPSSTKILIDGKRMTVYRCDYEIFEQGMLK
ncbi:DUF5052 family protein [Oceanirhabdus sp. W0125-5]|uniref:DUF5052 family protein n=1 Tax=Oceanirhabdus sp. W0125-5 TaxID=2999116 RepID=UPI0022F2CDB7|nr:DUF5052 family protein [Oceanirhabdus sp. W0125-5]WBW97815.1 DUF5052 family protein [Oceanirhabdus sp. W0125-5]